LFIEPASMVHLLVL